MILFALPQKDPTTVAPAVRKKKHPLFKWAIIGVLLLAAGAGVAWYAQGKGWKTRIVETLFPGEAYVFRTRPGDGETGVLPNEFVAADVHLPNFGHGVDPESLSSETVKLYRTSDGKIVDAHVNTSGVGDAIVIVPSEVFAPGTQYTFEVTSGVKDTKGTPFNPFKSTFTTSTKVRTEPFPAAFEKVPLEHLDSIFTGLALGPDEKLYASTFDGRIIRWNLLEDGRLGEHEVIETIQTHNRGPRLVIGLRFDPASTADNLILWITHGMLGREDIPDWTSKLSRLSGRNLEQYQDYVIGLPRAYRDHLSNQLDFGPDGCIYFTQGSNTSTGAPDKKWGERYERLMTAAMLRVDVRKIVNPPVNAQTEGKKDGPQPYYNPFAPDAPVTVYATGIRLGYDTLWHSGGYLYTAVNGSAAGGNTPAYKPGDDDAAAANRIDLALNGPFRSPPVPALPDVAARPDFLFQVEKGGFYGHPNPRRAEYVLDGGNPTDAPDVAEVPEYPVGTQPDRNWRLPALNFGKNMSPNGMIEYKSDAFGAALKGKILITRYSGGDDIIALTVGEGGAITEAVFGIEGFRQFLDPLDLIEHPSTGRIYVAEYKGSKLTLLRPRIDANGNSISPRATKLHVSPETRAVVR